MNVMVSKSLEVVHNFLTAISAHVPALCPRALWSASVHGHIRADPCAFIRRVDKHAHVLQGHGVAVNLTRASEHFRYAANEGDVSAMVDAGFLCVEGTTCVCIRCMRLCICIHVYIHTCSYTRVGVCTYICIHIMLTHVYM